MSLLKTISLTVGYPKKKGRLTVLKDLNLVLGKGHLVCFVGMNGTGKSTLLRTLAGLQPKLSGEILLGGKNLDVYSNIERSKELSVVLTHNEVSGILTAEELVQLGRYPYTNWTATLSEKDQQHVEEAMVSTGTQSLREKPFFELSDGQRQKVVIARAMAQDTPLIILDEPTNHLDLKNKVEIMNLLKTQVEGKGKTVIMSTHDLRLAMKFSDQIWLIDKDKQLVVDTPEGFRKNGKIDEVFTPEGFGSVDEIFG